MVPVMKTMRLPVPIPLLGMVLLAAALLAAGCTTSSSQAVQTPLPATAEETTIVPTPAVTTSCGLSKCHGFDVTCVSNPPEVCTAEYKLGDRCRKYIHCESSGGSCTLVKDAGFTACKTCVETCQLRGGDNNLWAQSCEEKC